MSGASPPVNHYETLGIDPSASAVQVRRAYVAKVRENSPERNPDGFKRVREAYETLKNAEQRAEYDAMLAHGETLQRLLANARRFIERGQFIEAQGPLRSARKLLPGNLAIETRLGELQALAGHFEQSAHTFETLIERVPNSASLHAWLGIVCRDWGLRLADDAVVSGSDRGRALLERACAALHRAVELDPDDDRPGIVLADVLHELGRPKEARALLVEQVERMGADSFDSFETRLHLAALLALRRQMKSADEVVRAALATVPREREPRTYAAQRFADACWLLTTRHAFEAAALFAGRAATLDPQNDGIRGLRRAVRYVVALSREVEAARREPACGPLLPYLLLEWARYAGLDEVDGVELNDLLAAGEAMLREVNGMARLRAVARVREVCPKFSRARHDWLSAVEAHTFTNVPPAGRLSAPPCFVVTATFGTPHAPVVARYRVFRDRTLARWAAGRLLIRAYERIGPRLARVVLAHPRLRAMMAPLLAALARWLPDERS